MVGCAHAGTRGRGACPMAAPLPAVMVEHVRTLEDARNPRTRQHTLRAILVMAVCPLLTSGRAARAGNVVDQRAHAFRTIRFRRTFCLTRRGMAREKRAKVAHGLL